MSKQKTTEQDQIANAPIVETSTAPPATETTDDALEAAVTALLTAQFGGENNEPSEGETRWDNMTREMVVEADKLETQYRDILSKKEANRTLLRALADMDKVPADIPNYYYPRRKRLTKAEKAAQEANS